LATGEKQLRQLGGHAGCFRYWYVLLLLRLRITVKTEAVQFRNKRQAYFLLLDWVIRFI
jgi:hypothetical protein